MGNDMFNEEQLAHAAEQQASRKRESLPAYILTREAFLRRLQVLADTRPSNDGLIPAEVDLSNLIAVTPWLDWLLLTKRPENVIDLWPGTSVRTVPLIPADGHRVFPNLWLGVSVEDQATADARIAELLRVPVAMRFVSYEPALGPVLFLRVPGLNRAGSAGREITRRLWIIVGGESGPKARPFDVDWAFSVIEQCRIPGVPVFIKQLGAYPIFDPRFVRPGATRRLSDRAGADPEEWPYDLRVREFPR